MSKTDNLTVHDRELYQSWQRFRLAQAEDLSESTLDKDEYDWGASIDSLSQSFPGYPELTYELVNDPKLLDADKQTSLQEVLLVIAEIAVTMGNEEEAEHCLTQAMCLGSVRAAEDLGYLLFTQKRFAEAEAVYRTVAEKSTLARRNLAIRVAERGDYAEAISIWQSLVDNGVESSLSGLANVYEDSGDLKSAEIYFRKALDAGEEVRGALGAVLRKQGRINEAIAVFEEGLALGEERVAFEYALLLEDVYKPDEAKSLYRKAIEEGEKNAYLNLANLVEDDGQWDEAESLIEKAISLGDTLAIESYESFQARRLLEEDRLDEAMALLPELVEKGKTGFLIDLGDGHLRQNRIDEAERAYRRALGEGFYAYSELGELLENQGRLIEAEEIYERGFAEDPLEVGDAYTTLLLGQEKQDKAIEVCETLISLGDVGCHHILALIYEEQGKDELAELSFKEGIKVGDEEDRAEAVQDYIEFLESKRRYSEADSLRLERA